MQENQATAARENIMGTMDINPLLVKLSVPMMVSMLVQALYNVVDSVFVSHVSESALTAVSLAFSLQNVMIAVGQQDRPKRHFSGLLQLCRLLPHRPDLYAPLLLRPDQ